MNSVDFSASKSSLPWLSAWIVRKRIAISLVAFSVLIAFNLLGRHTVPLSPTDLANPWAAAGVALVVCGVLIRSWAAGTLHKNGELTQAGPYAMVRNPLYLGSFLMMFGFCILMRDPLSAIFVAGPMLLLYRSKIISEEANLSLWFPDQWESYARTTPRIIPRLPSRRVMHGWSFRMWLNNREYRAVVGTAIGLIAIHFLAAMAVSMSSHS
ncbi:MAG: isoprenylcysteine carboxylmethyltransferase family protein [Planctomycetota bacterium]|nr:MAG: isoprenylcysteine carboxylmethyltransferase family protein [Planctomycetota bacterium]